MQIRYKGMFAAVEIPTVVFATKHPGKDDAGKPIKVDVPRTRLLYRDEVATIVEGDPRGLLDQPDNYEPVDAAAKALLKDIEREREERDVPDQPIKELVEATGREAK